MKILQRKPSLWTLFTLALLAFFVLFVVYPLFLILYQSVIDPVHHQVTLDYFYKFFGRKFYWITLVHSFAVTICATVVAAAIGLPMAYVLRSYRIPFSKYVNILIVISYLSPPFIGAYAWIQLLGRNGFFTKSSTACSTCISGASMASRALSSSFPSSLSP